LKHALSHVGKKKCKRFLYLYEIKAKAGVREGRELTKQTARVPRRCGDGPPLCADGMPRLRIGKGICAVRRAHGQNRAGTGAGAILTRRLAGRRADVNGDDRRRLFTCGQIRGFGLQRLEG